MRKHLHHRSLHGELRPGIHTDQHKTHVTDGAVGHQAFKVRLRKSEQRAVKNAGGAEHHCQLGNLHGGFRKERHRKADQAVSAGFKQNTGQQNTGRGGRLGVRVRQPGVKREARQLHHKGQEESPHQIIGEVRIDLMPDQLEVAEGNMPGPIGVHQRQCKDGHQHQQAADLGEQKKFHGRVKFVFVPPDGNQKIHGNQHHFPKDKEQEQIQSDKNADHAGQRPQQVKLKEPRPVIDFVPGRDHRHKTEEESQAHHQLAQAIHRQQKADAKTRYPVRFKHL